MFYFANLSTFSVIHSMRAIFSSILASFWWNLPLSSCSIPYSLDFLNSRCLGFLYWLYFHFLVLNSFIQFFSLCSCFPGFFFQRLIGFLLKDHYISPIVCFNIFFLYFSYVGVLTACCCGIAGLLWRHIIQRLLLVFMLVSMYLGLERLQSWVLMSCFVFFVWVIYVFVSVSPLVLRRVWYLFVSF